MEIKYRIATLKVAEKNAVTVNTPVQIFNEVKDLFNPLQEEMYLIVFNTRMKIIMKTLVAKGTGNQLILIAPDIFRSVLSTNGNKFALAHNHPSTEVSPSEEDLMFTKRIMLASNVIGFELVDHIVFSSTEFFSFRTEGLLK